MRLRWPWGRSRLFNWLLRVIKELGSERLVTIFESSGEITGLEAAGHGQRQAGFLFCFVLFCLSLVGTRIRPSFCGLETRTCSPWWQGSTERNLLLCLVFDVSWQLFPGRGWGSLGGRTYGMLFNAL